jgi:hypothetical protein
MPHDAPPTFFFSYARSDEEVPSLKLSQFFEDLQKTLVQRTAGLPPGIRLGTHDRRVAQGADWDDELSRGLKTNKALVAVATQPYFSSKNCGKEIAVFARRHPAARLDGDGALRHASNILHIRWLDDGGYALNRVKDAALHPLLRKVTWTPAEDGRSARTKAINRYRDKGMELCVKPARDYYVELLRAFADSVKNMPDLPEATFPVAWNSIQSAFEAGWGDVDREHSDGASAEAVPLAPVTPSGPADATVVYITRRALFLDPRAPAFADRLVDEPSWRRSLVPDAAEPFLAVLQAVQQAMLLEHLSGFHCACEPQVPARSDALIDQLAALTERNVLVALAIEPAIWLGENVSDETRTVLDDIVKSERWGGPVILPTLRDDVRTAGFAARLAEKNVPRSITVLSGNIDGTIAALRSAFVRERGRIMQTSRSTVIADDERLPLLRGPGSAQK